MLKVGSLTRAKEIAGTNGQLVVIVKNDDQCILKKRKPFMVDKVVLSVDKDRTVMKPSLNEIFVSASESNWWMGLVINRTQTLVID